MHLDLKTLPLPRWPNYCLAVPADWQRSEAHVTTPLYSVPLAVLREALVAVAAEADQTNLLELDKEALQAEFEQRSKIFGFPDRITVTFEGRGSDQSTLAIYSRSLKGIYDLRANRRRVETWLKRLDIKLQGQGHPKASTTSRHRSSQKVSGR